MTIVTIFGFDYIDGGTCETCHRERLVRFSAARGWICLSCMQSQSWYNHLSPAAQRITVAAFNAAYLALGGEQRAERLLDRSLTPRWAGLRAWLEAPVWG